MKQLISILVFFVVCVATSFAQDTFSKGNHIISGAVGLTPLYMGIDLTEYTFPPIAILMYEWGHNDVISIGAYASFVRSSYEDPDYDSDCNNINCDFTVIGARGAYHFYRKNKIDAYGGLFLGYNIKSYSDDCTGDEEFKYNTSPNEYAFAVFAGARYYFNTHLGVFAEVGYGLAFCTAGVSYKI